MQRLVDDLHTERGATAITNHRQSLSQMDATTAPGTSNNSFVASAGRSDRLSTLKPAKYELTADFDVWWPSFQAYAECQGVPRTNAKAFVLGFMGESTLASVRRAMGDTQYDSFDALYNDLKSCFEVTDVSVSELRARFNNRNQFANESLTSYYNDLWDWVERIDRVKRIKGSLDEEVVTRFIEGIHDRYVQAKMNELAQRAAMAFRWLQNLRCSCSTPSSMDSGANKSGQYFETFRTCAAFRCPRAQLEKTYGIPKDAVNTVAKGPSGLHAQPYRSDEYARFMSDVDVKNVNFGRAYYTEYNSDDNSDQMTTNFSSNDNNYENNCDYNYDNSSYSSIASTCGIGINSLHAGTHTQAPHVSSARQPDTFGNFGKRSRDGPLCFACSQFGHISSQCPNKQQRMTTIQQRAPAQQPSHQTTTIQPPAQRPPPTQ